MRKRKNRGFSLVEVLVFISIISLFFISAAGISILFLSHMKTNEHKILATRYAEELLEWLRAEKEMDWNTFISRSDNTYCFSNLPINTWPSSPGNCPQYNGLNPPIYKREVTLSTGAQATQINVSIKVSWQELGNTYSIPINTVFSIWE